MIQPNKLYSTLKYMLKIYVCTHWRYACKDSTRKLQRNEPNLKSIDISYTLTAGVFQHNFITNTSD